MMDPARIPYSCIDAWGVCLAREKGVFCRDVLKGGTVEGDALAREPHGLREQGVVDSIDSGRCVLFLKLRAHGRQATSSR